MEIWFYRLSFQENVLPGKQYLMVPILKCSMELLFMWAELLHEERGIFAFMDTRFKGSHCKKKK